MGKWSITAETILTAEDLYYAFQTYDLSVHIADGEGMIYDVSAPTWREDDPPARWRFIRIIPNLSASVDATCKKLSGMDNYGELIDTQDFPVSRSTQSPYLCHFRITPPPWIGAAMKMGGSLTFADHEDGRPGCMITNAGEINVNWFPISSMIEAAVPNGIKNGYANFPKVVKKYKRLRDWKMMFHRLATQEGRAMMVLHGPFDEFLEDLEDNFQDFATPPLGSSETPGTMPPCSPLYDMTGGRWESDEHVVDMSRHFGLEPPTHRPFIDVKGKSAPRSIPHLGPMLEDGLQGRGGRNRVISPGSGTKCSSQIEPDESKGDRRPWKRYTSLGAMLGVMLLLGALNWMGFTIKHV